MIDQDLSQKVLEQIQKEHIKPKPRWEFLLKDYVIWGLFVIVIAIGSVSVSVIIFMTRHDLPYVAREAKALMISLPYFWLILMALFLGLAYYNFKHTKTGYRYNAYVIFFLSFILSIALGSIIYASGGARKLEEACYHRLPMYQLMMDRRGQVWVEVSQGKLAGTILEVKPENIRLESFDDKLWLVWLPLESGEHPPLMAGMRVRVFGEKLSDDEFQAQVIMPWFSRPPVFEREMGPLRIIR